MIRINRKEFIGQKFGSYEIIAIDESVTRYPKCICICVCGKKRNFNYYVLKSLKEVRCRQCYNNNRPTKNKTGKIYGNLKILSLIKREKDGKSLWLCECLLCQERMECRSNLLRLKGKQNCWKCSIRKDYCGKLSGKHFNRILKAAQQRGYEFKITKEDIWNLFLLQDGTCKLTGLPLQFGESSYNYSENTTASLDRIDSNKGYLLDNVQWIHKIINIMKNALSDEDFIYYCKLVADYDNKKKQLAVANDIQEDEWTKWL